MRTTTQRMALAASIVLVWVLASRATATTVTFREGVGGYTGTQDTYLDNTAGNQTTDHGAETYVRIQGDAGEGDTNKKIPLLRFDNIIGPGAGQIPTPAVAGGRAILINSATLTLVSGDTHSNPISLHRLLQGWVESSTWSSSFGGNGVETNNVEAVSTSDSSASSFTAGSAFALNVAPSLQAWVNGASNDGWAFINTTAIGGNVAPWATSEFGTTGSRPLLTVAYTIVPEPGAALLLALGTGLVWWRRRR